MHLSSDRGAGPNRYMTRTSTPLTPLAEQGFDDIYICRDCYDRCIDYNT